MVTFASATKNTPSFPTRAPAQRRVGHSVAISCSVPNDLCELYNDDCRSHTQLVSPSRDPIGYLGSPNLFELNIFLTTVDPQGFMQQPVSCQGIVVPIVGQQPKCSVVCACPGFKAHEPIEAHMIKEMTEEEWKNWGLPPPWPGTYETQCNTIADAHEKLNICPDDGDGGEPVTPFVPTPWYDQPHCIQESWSPLDIAAAVKTGCGGGIGYGWRCVRWRWYTVPSKNPTKNPFVYPRKKPLPIKFPVEFPQAA